MPVSTRRTVRSKPSTAPTAPNTASPSPAPSPSSLYSRLSEMNTYKITTLLLTFFAATHTVFGLILPNDFGVEGNDVFSAMQTVRFNFMGSRRTLHDFYMGFGLGVTVFLCMSATLSWILSVYPDTAGSAAWGLTKADAKEIEDGNAELGLARIVGMLKWVLFMSNLAHMVLCYVYLFIPPMVVSTVIAALLGWECFKDLTYWERKKAEMRRTEGAQGRGFD
ncbi:uncharacterized protein Z520_02905 [Fonsecaea multimorphosa CBS 102226]|uniref:Uncharacterized protein n=1 Tax=Fonsecaea multimorphosa CBS 102226 TaxID=1442371 RepID=A0A0D2K695_9EURO|nr:uncharacterized protein Z520_02905 [Fonsecaea multimorphosa CBS 102226]KIY01353.1 hypothetical protein Z520_02905 [Fonsecaea multimorphosa CBS 102226]OAL28629.1 hypothetical protein AYO22_02823 [Fonsecaea multimorphosa]